MTIYVTIYCDNGGKRGEESRRGEIHYTIIKGTAVLDFIVNTAVPQYYTLFARYIAAVFFFNFNLALIPFTSMAYSPTL